MPAVLVETGYVTNAEEELRLKDPSFADRFAGAVVEAVNEESQALLASCAPSYAPSAPPPAPPETGR